MWYLICFAAGAAVGIAVYHFGFQKTVQTITADVSAVKDKISPPT